MHIRLDQLIAYRDGALEESERQVVESHLSECAECRLRYSAFEQLSISLKEYFANHRPAKGSDCPDESYWMQYLREELNASDKERLKEHLQQCDYCFDVAASVKKSLMDQAVSETLRLPAWMRQRVIVGSKHSGRRMFRPYRWAQEVWASLAAPPKWAYALTSLVIVLFIGWFVWHRVHPTDTTSLAQLPGKSVLLAGNDYQLLIPSKPSQPVSLPQSSEGWQRWYNALTSDDKRPKSVVALLTPSLAQALRTIGQSSQGDGLELLRSELKAQVITMLSHPIGGILVERTLAEQLIRGTYLPNQHLSVTFLTTDEPEPTAKTILKIETAR